jgi:hypothetical protein
MVLTVSFALSLVNRACLPPSPADMSCLSPVGPTRLRKLDASVGASGPRDFAVRCNISRPLAVDRSQVFQLALPSHRAQNAAASTASLPASVTIAIRPSVGWDGESSSFDLGQREQIFFGKSEIKDSTALSTNRPTGKSPDRAVQSAAWKFQAFFSLCKAALQVTAPFRLADRVEQCALSEPKPTLLQVTGLQLLDPDSDIGGRTSKNKAASTKTSGYPLRLSPEGAMLACRGRTMANKTKGQDHSGHAPDVPRENAQAPAEASQSFHRT